MLSVCFSHLLLDISHTSELLLLLSSAVGNTDIPLCVLVSTHCQSTEGNHFVIGGALQGGKVVNRYPWTLISGGSRDLGRGRLIPEYPWEGIAVPIARWMGVEEAQRATGFPNLNTFHSDQLIAHSTLFR